MSSLAKKNRMIMIGTCVMFLRKSRQKTCAINYTEAKKNKKESFRIQRQMV